MFAQSRQGLALNKKFKVDEDSSQIKILDSLKYLPAVF